MSIYITQLVYLKHGQEKVFDEFEKIAIPAILKYNGRLLFRVRPSRDQFIESTIDAPYEIHLVEFNSDDDFYQFTQDKERANFIHLKNQSITSVVLIKGIKL